MQWNVSTATIIGRDHELTKKNRQDFLSTYTSDDRIIGVVCDGCGESQYSEVGASILGTFIINYFKRIQCLFFDFHDETKSFVLPYLIEQTIDSLLKILEIDKADKIAFIKDFMLTTNLFCFISNEIIFLGYCGDGIIIVDDKVEIIDQKGSPHYIAYKNIPKEALEKQPTELTFFNFRTYKLEEVNKIVIATDGLLPIIEKSMINELYKTQKRQLQRKFNLWQQQKLFGDDASCIVFEKIQEFNENSNLQTTTNPT